MTEEDQEEKYVYVTALSESNLLRLDDTEFRKAVADNINYILDVLEAYAVALGSTNKRIRRKEPK